MFQTVNLTIQVDVPEDATGDEGEAIIIAALETDDRIALVKRTRTSVLIG